MHECAISRNENHLEDLISKKSLIATIEKEAGMNIPEWLRDTIMNASPSAKETAEWVWDEDAIDWGMGAWVCSKCKNRPQTFWETSKKIYPLKWVGSQYCGCCGAKMQKGE